MSKMKLAVVASVFLAIFFALVTQFERGRIYANPLLQPAAAPQNAPAIPDTPAGRFLREFLAVMERGDATEMKVFVERTHSKRMNVDRITSMHMEFSQETGGFELGSVEKSSDLEIAVRVRAKRSGEWLLLTIELEPQAPHLLAAIGLDPAAEPAKPATGNEAPKPGRALSESELAQAIEQFVDQLAARDEFSGAVLLAKDGRPFFQKAWGLANVRYNVPNRVDTKFNLGSMNKMFTAVALAQLAEKGKLSFDDKVGKHLPDYPNQDVREKVTLHHLLTHTSGLGSYWNAKYDATWPRIRSVKGFLDTFADESPQFEPGARFEYSNAGFIVLGAIIEKVSGMSYYDYVRENIFKPAGMNDTDCYEMDQEIPNLAFGYTNQGIDGQPGPSGARRSNLFLHSAKGGPAGGGFSTVPDLLRFQVALRSGKLLSPKMTETVLAGRVSMDGGPSTSKYAYGFGEQRVNGQRIVGHNGGAPGISAWLDMYWDSGYTVAVLSNYDRGSFPVVRRAKDMLTQQQLANSTVPR